MKIFLLIVISNVYGGSQVSFQEFNSLETCQLVAAKIEDKGGFGNYNRQAFCVEK